MSTAFEADASISGRLEPDNSHLESVEEQVTQSGLSTWRPWVRAAVLVGLMYALVGVTFAMPTGHVRAWRLAAWGISVVAFAAHAVYEHFALRQGPRSAAIHVAVAAGLGALGLAVAANLHSLSTAATAHQHRLLLVALVAWPVITTVPAFLAGLVIGAVLSHLPGSADRG